MFKKSTVILIFLTLCFSNSVTFDIDGLDECGFVSVTGTWDGWSGWGAHTDSNMSASIEDGNYEFVILCVDTSINEWWNNIWNASTVYNAPIGGSCWNGNNEYPNYTFSVIASDITVSFCAGSCDQVCQDNSDGGADSGGDNENDEGYTLVWSDEFNGSTIDESKWNFETGNGNWGWGNGEHQYYRQENASIENGKLVIEARNESYGGFNYTSTRMQTRNKADFLYGKVSASIKVPSAGGTWPAFWMMPTNSVYGGWPNSGEIDIMEHYGCDPGHVHSTVHNNIYNWNGGIPPTSYSTYTSATSGFHVYEVEWNENQMDFYVDDEYLGTYFKSNGGWQQWPYDQEFYLILNLAIGSHFMQCDTQDDLFPQRLEVDYVRVYQLIECPLQGDVSGDDNLDVIDIVQLVEFILNPNSSEIDNCSDINNDGSINIIDVVIFVEMIVNP